MKKFDSETAKVGDRLVWRESPEIRFTFKGMAHGYVIAKIDEDCRIPGYAPEDVIARPRKFALYEAGA